MSIKPNNFGTNAVQASVIIIPISLFFLDNLEPYIATLFSLILIIGGAISTAFFMAQIARSNSFLDRQISNDKDIAQKQAAEICFNGLWFIPKKNLLNISDAIWSVTIKRHHQSVRAAMVVSDDLLQLILGGLALMCVYMGFHAEFGPTLSKITSYSGASIVVQIGLLSLTPWISLIFLFNYFFRKFVS